MSLPNRTFDREALVAALDLSDKPIPKRSVDRLVDEELVRLFGYEKVRERIPLLSRIGIWGSSYRTRYFSRTQIEGMLKGLGIDIPVDSFLEARFKPRTPLPPDRSQHYNEPTVDDHYFFEKFIGTDSEELYSLSFYFDKKARVLECWDPE